MERNSEGYSFIISYTDPGLHGYAGYLVSWRPVYEVRGAIRITRSPFKTFDEAEAACDAMLKHLTSDYDCVRPTRMAVIAAIEAVPRPIGPIFWYF